MVTSKLVIKILCFKCHVTIIKFWCEERSQEKKTKQYKQKYIKYKAIILHSTGRCIANKHGYFSVLNTNFQIITNRNISQLFFLLLHVFYFCTCSIQSIIVITCTSKHSLEMHCISTCYIHCEMDTVHSPLSFSSTHYIIFYKTRSVRTSLYTPSNGIIVLSQSQLGEVYQLHRLNED